jgi:uncharacterized membrane protein
LPPPGRGALIVLPVVTVSFLAIAFLNLLYWTDVGSNYVQGLQGRYFIPLTPPLFLLACSLARRVPRPAPTLRLQKLLDFAAVTISGIICACLLGLVIHRFYG